MSRSRPSDNLIGQSNSFIEVLEHVSQVAPLNKPILIIGERGTGKELIAARFVVIIYPNAGTRNTLR